MLLTITTLINHWLTYLLLGRTIGEENENPENNSRSALLGIVTVIIRMVTNIRYMYIEFYFLAASLTMWLISCNFSDSVHRTVQWPSQSLSRNNIDFIKHYKLISRLSGTFSRAYGYVYFSYVIFYCIYYSVSLSELLLPMPAIHKLYEIKFLLLNLASVGFIVGFSLRVCNQLLRVCIQYTSYFDWNDIALYDSRCQL